MSVPAAILGVTDDWRTRLAMLMGSHMEGGWDPSTWLTNPGDNGHSYGPFQINLPYHPDIDQAGAVDPGQAAAYMVGAYADAVRQIPAGLWSSDPEQAGEQAAVAAERPAEPYYSSQGQGAVDAAYADALAALNGAGPGSGSSPGFQLVGDLPGTHTHVPGTGGGHGWDPLGIGSKEQAIGQYLLKGLFVALALGLVGAGLWRAVSPHAPNIDPAMLAALA